MFGNGYGLCSSWLFFLQKKIRNFKNLVEVSIYPVIMWKQCRFFFNFQIWNLYKKSHFFWVNGIEFSGKQRMVTTFAQFTFRICIVYNLTLAIVNNLFFKRKHLVSICQFRRTGISRKRLVFFCTVCIF